MSVGPGKGTLSDLLPHLFDYGDDSFRTTFVRHPLLEAQDSDLLHLYRLAIADVGDDDL